MAGLPRILRQITDDTRALLSDLRAAARGMSTRWQWLRLKSSRRIGDAAARMENVRRAAESRTRMCRECRALIPVSAATCPECGSAPGRAVSTGLGRVLESMAPGLLSASSLILTVTMLIYVLTWAVYLRLSASGTSQLDPWGVALIALGANSSGLTVGGEPWRLLTSVFLHGSLLHIGMNCYALMTVGPLIEEIYGFRKLLAFYVATGVAGAAASAWWHFPSLVPGVGASGAIFGLIGVAAVWGWRRGGTAGGGMQALMTQWALYGLVMGLLIRADNAAHIGGLASGALLGLIVGDQQARSAVAARLWDAAAWFCILVTAASFIMVALNYDRTLAMIGSY